MKTATVEYIPYGKEWEAEIMKFPKKDIIGLLKIALTKGKDEYAAIQSKAKTDIMNKIAKAISDEFTIDDDVTGGYLEEPYRGWVSELYQEFIKTDK